MKYYGVAIRNLNRQKKRSFLLGGAIAFGILVVTLINSFSGSIITNVGENFSQLMAGHIFLTGHEKTSTGKTINVIREDKKIIDALRQNDLPIRYFHKRSAFSGYLIFEGESITQQITGVDWSREKFLKERLVIIKGSLEEMSDPRGIIVNQKVAEKLNIEIGETLLVQLKTVTDQYNVGEFRLVAVSYDPGIFASISAYANLSYVNELLNLKEGEYQTLGIFLSDIRLIDYTAEKIYKTLIQREVPLFPRTSSEEGEYLQSLSRDIRAQTWEDTKFRLFTLNDFLYQVRQMVNILNTIALVVLLILFLIIMIGITNTFRMVIYERTREIGTMRALGLQRKGVRNLFLMEALFLSLGGVLLGLLLSGLLMFILSRINFGMDTPMFIFLRQGHLTFAMDPVRLILNISIIAVLTLLAAFFPARKAAKMEPAQALGKYY